MQPTTRQANTPKGRRGTVQVRAALTRASPDPRAASPPLQTQESRRADGVPVKWVGSACVELVEVLDGEAVAAVGLAAHTSMIDLDGLVGGRVLVGVSYSATSSRSGSSSVPNSKPSTA
jgi:hypothetical protein